MVIEFCEITLSKDTVNLFIKPQLSCQTLLHQACDTDTRYTSKTHVISHCTHGISTLIQYNVPYLFSYYSIRFITSDLDYNRNTSHNLHQIPNCHETVINCCSRTISNPFPKRREPGETPADTRITAENKDPLHLSPRRQHLHHTVQIHDLNLITDIPGMHQLNTTSELLTIMRIFTSTDTHAASPCYSSRLPHVSTKNQVSRRLQFANDPIN